MIDTIIFDFGNVFINLDIKNGYKTALEKLRIPKLPKAIVEINEQYEIGAISTEQFTSFYADKFQHLTRVELVDLWNIILKDFPKHRLDFIKHLKSKNKYKLILLSNTNALHINWIKAHIPFYEAFKNCFDAFYLSHEIHLRKPNTAIFEFVLKEHSLNPNHCLFIDDNADNIHTASRLGIATWHILPYEEDVANLFETHKHLFKN